ncbi:hypothetical protein EJB05_23690, partial [Eragrostis curvula]
MKRSRVDLLATAGSSCWSSIPGDLLEQISGHLSTDADLLHIHQACAHWRASTSPPASCRPWIRAVRTGWSRPLAPGDTDYSFWLPRRQHQRQVETRAPPAGVPYCLGASRGWLAMGDRRRVPWDPASGARPLTRLVLWDPASGAEVQLPCLRDATHVFLSGDPLASPHSWMAVASQRVADIAIKPFFWRPGGAAAWSPLGERNTAAFISVAFHGGRAYCVDAYRVVYVYDLGTAARPPALVGARNAGAMVDEIWKCHRFSYRPNGAHLVTGRAGGELLLVAWRRGPGIRWAEPAVSSCCSPLCSFFAVVFKLDWTRDEPELGERVTDLGEHALFLGHGECLALSSKEFPGIKRNHVYCVAPEWNVSSKHDRTLPDWAFVFDLGSGTSQEIPYPRELRDDGTNWRPFSWFCLRTPFMKQQQ